VSLKLLSVTLLFIKRVIFIRWQKSGGWRGLAPDRAAEKSRADKMFTQLNYYYLRIY